MYHGLYVVLLRLLLVLVCAVRNTVNCILHKFAPQAHTQNIYLFLENCFKMKLQVNKICYCDSRRIPPACALHPNASENCIARTTSYTAPFAITVCQSATTDGGGKQECAIYSVVVFVTMKFLFTYATYTLHIYYVRME